MFPEPTPLSGKRLVPRLMVGCVVFAFVGLLGTFALAGYFGRFLHPDKAQLARQAAEREARSKPQEER